MNSLVRVLKIVNQDKKPILSIIYEAMDRAKLATMQYHSMQLYKKPTLDDAKMITSFIYNSLKVVNLMKLFIRDRDLMRLGITQFATLFISIESLIRYKQDLKRMCTTTE